MNTIIRAGSAQEFLALVPTLAGFQPARSLVCVAFEGRRTLGVLRHDLPRRARDRSALVSAVVASLCRMPGVDAIAPVVFTEERFADHDGVPERRLVELLCRRAAEAGFGVRDALCRAADGWGSYLDGELPAGGRPLGELDDASARSAVPAEAIADGPSAAARLPEPDERRARAIARELRRIERADAGDSIFRALGDDVDPVELVERLLAPRSASALRRAWFLHLASRPVFRDGMMLQFGFGPIVGAAAHDDAVDLAERAEAQGESVDVLVRREFARHDSGLGVSEFLSRLMLGRTTLQPDRARLERALDVVRDVVADAPSSHRSGPLCIAAWLCWALGRGSAAGALLDAVLAADPDYSMARLLEEYLGTGALPDWAFARPARFEAS